LALEQDVCFPCLLDFAWQPCNYVLI
jgi:hypothetical protein